MRFIAIAVVWVLGTLGTGLASAGETDLPSLITATPYEGRQLAIKLARKSIGEMQSDYKVRQAAASRFTGYDAGVAIVGSDQKIEIMNFNYGLVVIEAAEVIAIEFATIAAANNYWRE